MLQKIFTFLKAKAGAQYLVAFIILIPNLWLQGPVWDSFPFILYLSSSYVFLLWISTQVHLHVYLLDIELIKLTQCDFFDFICV